MSVGVNVEDFEGVDVEEVRVDACVEGAAVQGWIVGLFGEACDNRDDIGNKIGVFVGYIVAAFVGAFEGMWDDEVGCCVE